MSKSNEKSVQERANEARDRAGSAERPGAAMSIQECFALIAELAAQVEELKASRG